MDRETALGVIIICIGIVSLLLILPNKWPREGDPEDDAQDDVSDLD